MPNYQCINFGQCAKADSGEEIEIQPGAETTCPQCGQKLESVERKKISPRMKLVLVAVPVALVLAALLWFLFSGQPKASPSETVEDALVHVWPWLEKS